MLKNKVIVVTGGAGLLGQEFVNVILLNKGIAIIADINETVGINSVNSLKRIFPKTKVDFQVMNITDKESILNAIETINAKYGKIDALVNNAYPRNSSYGKKFEEVTYESFCENIQMHLGGYFLTSQQFLNYFIRQGFGNIVNISSIYGLVAPRFEIYENTTMTVPIEYAAIKSALIHITKYMAKYFKGHKIKINSICLGGIFDDQPEIFINSYNKYCLQKGMLNKSDVNGTLLYLLSDLSEFVNGTNIIVDDGFTL